MLQPIDSDANEKSITYQIKCPRCGNDNLSKVGKERGRQEYKCKNCQRRFIESPKQQSASDILPANITSQEMLEFDIWDVRILGLKPSSAGTYTLNFSTITSQWLRIAVKHWLKYRISIEETATIYLRLTHIRAFAKFIENYQPTLLAQQINRDIIVEYLVYLTKTKKSPSTRAHYIASLNHFLNDSGRYNWADVPKERLIYPEDYPKEPYFLPRFIPEPVKKQIEDNLYALPETITCMVKILWETGIRISELCNLKFDCIRQDVRGAWWIDIYQIKMKKEIPPLIITKELAYIIHKQQQYIRNNLGETYSYLFCETQGCGWFQKRSSLSQKKNFKPKPLDYFVPIPKKIAPQTLRGYLYQFAEEQEIRDASNEIFPLGRVHQFRHTHATELINNGVPQHIVQKRLGHKSPAMTMRYTHIHDQTMKQQMEKFWDGKIVNIKGEIIVSENPELDNIEMEWIKRNMKAQTLSDGFCGLPITQNCPVQGSPCLTCQYFRTTKEHLDTHKKRLENTEKLIENARAKGWQRQEENNVTIAENLRNIIHGLERKDVIYGSETDSYEVGTNA